MIYQDRMEDNLQHLFLVRIKIPKLKNLYLACNILLHMEYNRIDQVVVESVPLMKIENFAIKSCGYLDILHNQLFRKWFH